MARPQPPSSASVLEAALRDLKATFDSFVARWSTPPPRPGVPLLLAALETDDMAAYKLTLGVDPTPDATVTVRHLHVTLDGADQPILDTPPGTNWVIPSVSDGAALACFVVDTNPAGDSPAGPTLTLTIAPPAGGGGGVPPTPGMPFVVSQEPLATP